MKKLLTVAIILIGFSSCVWFEEDCRPIGDNCEECYDNYEVHISTECYDDEGNLTDSWYR